MPSYPPVPLESGKNFTKLIHADTYPFIDPATNSNHTGHYVFITGASKGVGRATALAFAKAGAAGIALGARSDFGTLEDEIVSAAGGAGKKEPKVLKIKLDVMSYASVESAAEAIEKEFGKLDILINNAGYLSTFEPMGDTDPEDYWRNYEINLRGVYFVTRACLPLMLRGGEKTIVNVSSRGANTLSAGASGYQTTKFALLRFTEFLVVDYGEQGLLAFAVHPASSKTELAANVPENLHQFLTDTPEIASDTICFLAAKKRYWLAGRYIDCTWDMEELLNREKEIVDGDKFKMKMKF